MAELLKRFEFPRDGSWSEIWLQAMEGQIKILAQGRGAYVPEDEAVVVIRDAAKSIIARIPFEPPEEPIFRAEAFDRTGDTYWMALGEPMDTWLYAVDIATGRVASMSISFAGETWLLPDWENDRTIRVATVDDNGLTQVTSRSLGAPGYITENLWSSSWKGWMLLDHDRERACPAHCRGARIVGATRMNIVVFPADSGPSRRGPRMPANRGALHPEASTADRFAISTGSEVAFYDASTLEPIGSVPTPQLGKYRGRPTVTILAENRVLVSRDSPENLTNPTAQWLELWQL